MDADAPAKVLIDRLATFADMPPRFPTSGPFDPDDMDFSSCGNFVEGVTLAIKHTGPILLTLTDRVIAAGAKDPDTIKDALFGPLAWAGFSVETVRLGGQPVAGRLYFWTASEPGASIERPSWTFQLPPAVARRLPKPDRSLDMRTRTTVGTAGLLKLANCIFDQVDEDPAL